MDGKQVTTWSMTIGSSGIFRSISTAPKNDNPDMYEIRSEKPDVHLHGRYALVLKGLD